MDDDAYGKVEILDHPDKIEIGKEFELSVSLSNLSDPLHYLSISLHKKSGDSYFGQTQNRDNWIEADDANCKSFPSVAVSEGSWSGKLKGKVFYSEKDFDNSLGNYILKLIKYTDSCNKSYSDDVSIELFDPSPPPTATPTIIPSNTPKLPTSTPQPTVTKAPTNSPALTRINSPTPKKANIFITSKLNVLGDETSTATHPLHTLSESSPSVTPVFESIAKKDILPLILIGTGGALLLGGAIYAGIIIKKQSKISSAETSENP